MDILYEYLDKDIVQYVTQPYINPKLDEVVKEIKYLFEYYKIACLNSKNSRKYVYKNGKYVFYSELSFIQFSLFVKEYKLYSSGIKANYLVLEKINRKILLKEYYLTDIGFKLPYRF